MQLPSGSIVTSNGQYVLPIQGLQGLQSQPILLTSGTDSSANAVPNIQYQVIPQIHTADGQLGFSASTVDGASLDASGQIQILPDGSQAISVTGTASASILSNSPNLMAQTGQVQQIQGVTLGSSAFNSQGQVVANMGLPGNITFVPINSVDLDSLGLSGAQTIATGLTADGQLIMTNQTVENTEGSEKTGEQLSQQTLMVNNTNAAAEMFVPTTSSSSSSSSSSSQMPASTIDGTGVLTQGTPEQTEGFLSQSQVQASTGQQVIQLQQVPLQSSDSQLGQQQIATQGQQPLQNVQLINPGTFLIQAQTVTPSGQIQWQTFQVNTWSDCVMVYCEKEM